MSKKFFLGTTMSALLVCSSVFAAPVDAQGAATQVKAKAAATTTPPTKEELSQISEAFGNFIGRNLKATGIEFDIDAIVKGIRDGSAGKPSPLSDAEYEQKMIGLQESAFKRVAETNLKAAEDFLSNNSKASGVKELEPGKLQILVVKEGTGPVVTDSSTPQINYTGKYIDGTVFGNSEDAGGPITIPLDQTIPGFSKGLLGMKEGEKRRIFVHPDLGYGTTGHLQPNSLLIFDVEVVKASAPLDKAARAGANFDDNDDDDLDEDADDDLDDATPKGANAKTAAPATPVKK